MKTGPKPQQFAACIGIDWADRKHDFCLWDAAGETATLGRVELHCLSMLKKRGSSLWKIIAEHPEGFKFITNRHKHS